MWRPEGGPGFVGDSVPCHGQTEQRAELGSSVTIGGSGCPQASHHLDAPKQVAVSPRP